MLLDDIMPVYDVVERHHILVRAAPATVFAAIKSFDLSSSLLTRALLFARALPSLLLALVRSPRAALAEPRARRAELRFADFERAGFRIVAERAPDELVIGVLGKFWRVRSDLRTDVSAANFAAAPPDGYALAGWNFTVEPYSTERVSFVLKRECGVQRTCGSGSDSTGSRSSQGAL